MKHILNLSFILLLFASACAQSNDSQNDNFKRISQEEFKKELQQDVQLIDVRTPEEFAAGHIEGAININFHNDFENEIQKIDLTKKTLIYCQSGGRSAKALEMMKPMGFPVVYELEGGFSEWK